MFTGAIQNQDISKWNVANVKSMENMFQLASAIQNQNISEWNIANVKDTAWNVLRSVRVLIHIFAFGTARATCWFHVRVQLYVQQLADPSDTTPGPFLLCMSSSWSHQISGWFSRMPQQNRNHHRCKSAEEEGLSVGGGLRNGNSLFARYQNLILSINKKKSKTTESSVFDTISCARSPTQFQGLDDSELSYNNRMNNMSSLCATVQKQLLLFGRKKYQRQCKVESPTKRHHRSIYS